MSPHLGGQLLQLFTVGYDTKSSRVAEGSLEGAGLWVGLETKKKMHTATPSTFSSPNLDLLSPEYSGPMGNM